MQNIDGSPVSAMLISDMVRVGLSRPGITPFTDERQHAVSLAYVVPAAGALGGVLTGLERLPADADYGLFLAVDLPLVPAGLHRLRGDHLETGGDRQHITSLRHRQLRSFREVVEGRAALLAAFVDAHETSSLW